MEAMEENRTSLVLSSPPVYFVKQDRKKERGGKFGSAGGSPKGKIGGLENTTSEERLNGLGLARVKETGLRKIWLTALKLPSFCRERHNNVFSVVTRGET